MPNKNWSQLNHLQLGRYAEYYAKMEFASYGFEIYTSEVDDRGIDFVARLGESIFYEIQVKSIRDLNYIFFQKDKFSLRESLLAAVVIFIEGAAPHFFLIPSLSWENPNTLLVFHDYKGKKSNPEWGINISMKNLPLLSKYSFDKSIKELK